MIGGGRHVYTPSRALLARGNNGMKCKRRADSISRLEKGATAGHSWTTGTAIAIAAKATLLCCDTVQVCEYQLVTPPTKGLSFRLCYHETFRPSSHANDFRRLLWTFVLSMLFISSLACVPAPPLQCCLEAPSQGQFTCGPEPNVFGCQFTHLIPGWSHNFFLHSDAINNIILTHRPQ